ncbi:hypothetical protein [Thalassoroseus pseudoceratinae]|uniref:hypothetical protein n=1 Tax=Thalassoroseus pseudoceratinae TaxID=2713176 RepID=UPI00141E41E4|nr:hypothetical protein [Thalassoroseus pseudoceratinae]
MPDHHYAFHVSLSTDDQTTESQSREVDEINGELKVGELIDRLLNEFGIEGRYFQWQLMFEGTFMPFNNRLNEWFMSRSDRIPLVLCPKNDFYDPFKSDSQWPVQSGNTNQEIATHWIDPRNYDDSHESAFSDDCPSVSDFSFAPETQRGENSVPAPAQQSRNATIRYYSRMNPQRVYPFLVTITKQMVIEAVRKDVGQDTKAFRLALTFPVEIEPILPGCDCYPARIVTRLDDNDFLARFRIVPRVLGKVDGASVVIRQNHAVLTEIELKARVVQKIWLIVAGIFTFVLPAFSTLATHFGLDFESQSEQGFSFYLTVANLLLDQLTPLNLTIGLALITAAIWWRTRPQSHEVFWTIRQAEPVASAANS